MRSTLALFAIAGVAHTAAADSSVPLVFEPNHGQAPGATAYLARRPGYAIMLAQREAVIELDAGDRVRTLRMQFVGARDARIEGDGVLPGRVNYVVGPPTAWRTNIPLFARVAYRGLYPQVDLVMRGGDDHTLEYDFIVAAGGNPRDIELAFEGAQRLELDPAGNLRIVTAEGAVVQQAPIAYQDIAGQHVAVASRFVLDRGHVRFAVGVYDHEHPLVIDPPLAYSTFIGGDGTDRVNAIATDASGKLYITGETTSFAGPLAGDFPIKDPLDNQLDGYSNPPTEPRPFPSIRKFDAFVGKLDTTKAGPDSLVYMTFFGGEQGDDRAFAIAVDSAGRAHVGGTTSSKDLPLVNPLQTCTTDGFFVCDLNMSFVARLSPSGQALEYSSFINGNDVDVVEALAVGPQGRLYLAGRTASTFNFPLTPTAVQTTNHGVFDGFVTVLALDAPAASQVVYSTLIGGCSDDEVHAIAVDPNGRVVLGGTTQAQCPNPATTFPIKNAIQPTYAGGLSDGFVAAIDPAIAGDSGLVFATFFGGSYDENDLRRSGLALDGAGNIFVAGTTSSPNFPTTAGASQRCPGMTAQSAQTYPCDPTTGQFPGGLPPNGVVVDGYVTVLAPAGQLIHSTFLGGNGQDSIADIAVREDGALAYVTGTTNSTGLGSSCAPQPQLKLGRDAFQATLALSNGAAGTTSARTFFTYLGGGADDFGNSIAYDELTHSTFVGGYTVFNTTSFAFPTTANGLQTQQPGAGFDNGFVAQIPKIDACAPDLVIRKLADPEPVTAGCGLTYTIEVQNLGVLAATQVTVTDPLPAPVAALSVAATQGTCSGTTTITCNLGTLPVGAKATITIVAAIDGSYGPTQPPLVNTATVAGLETEADTANNTASWTSHVTIGIDSDGDGSADCADACPADPHKSAPGVCGCGVADAPAFTVSDPSVVEGDDGTAQATFVVTLAEPTCVDRELAFVTQAIAEPDAATPGVDYAEAAGTFTIPAWSTMQFVGVAVTGDVTVETAERFRLVVSDQVSVAGVATIVDDDDPPVVTLLGPSTIAEGEAQLYTFAVTAKGPVAVASTSCGSGSLVGGVMLIPLPSGAAGSFTCVFPDGPDATQVHVVVEAGGALSNTSSIGVAVANVAPLVTVSGATAPTEGSVATYAFVVSDPGTDTFSLVGDPSCGPGALVAGSLALSPDGSGGSFQCVFADDATGAIGLTVADSDGASGTGSLAIAVANVPPVVVLAGPTSVGEGVPVTYSFTLFDPADATLTVAVDCGDAGTLVAGSLELTTTTTGSFACVFPAGPATSTVSVVAFDPTDAGTPGELQVVIADVSPTLAIGGPATLGEGQLAQFSFTVGDADGGFAIAPGFPDCGTSATLVADSLVVDPAGGSFACQAGDGPATTDVRLQVVDAEGKGSNIATTPLSIANLAPIVAISGPTTVASNATATYAFTVSDAGGDSFVPAVSCGAAGTAGNLVVDPSGGSFACTFGTGPTSSTVSVVASDADGAASDTASIAVAIAAPVLQIGAMQGHATIASAVGPVKLMFSLSCAAGQGAKNLHVTWGAHKLMLQQVTSTTCSDDPAIDPGAPVVGFDTLTGTGIGRYDGVPGYAVAFAFADAGEPGPDRAHVTITDAQGTVLFDVAGAIASGNFDAQP